MTSSHGKRLMTAAIAVPLLVFVVLKGGVYGFAFLVALVVAAGSWEYYGLFLADETGFARGIGVFFSLLLWTAFAFGGPGAPLGAFVAAFLGVMLFYLWRGELMPATIGKIAKHIMGFAYVPMLLGHLVLIRGGADGVSWTFFLLAVVFATDTGAYYVGTWFGRRKLTPRISPKKTWEGAIGGLAASVCVGVVFKGWWALELSWAACLALTIATTVAAQLGDLVESMMKRSVNIKDSGGLLPGHGGILDRIDGLLFAIPVVYYFVTYLN